MTSKRRRRRRRTLIICAVILAATVAIAVGVLAANGRHQPGAETPPPMASSSPTSQVQPPPATHPDSPGTPRNGPAPQCATSDLKIDVSEPDGAAGTSRTTITFTNTSSNPCSLHGYPGVSLRANGQQIGQDAKRVGNYETPVTLQPGESAHDLLIDSTGSCTDSGVFSDVVRIYPPNQTDYVEPPVSLAPCDLTIDPIVPISQGP